MELQPGNAELLRNLPWGLFRAREFREPRKEYEAAIHLNPRDWQAHCGLGEVLARQKHLAEGIKEVETGVQMNPRYSQAYRLLDRLYRQANQPAKAAAALARAQSLAAEAQPRN